jgi:multiple sugar transport system ATP-binding protein
MSDLIFSHVRKVFGDGIVAVEDFNLTVPSPRMVVLVGPSGCGKTTLLRMIAGLETPTSGTINLGETRLDTMEPRDRDIAMVFQSYALYPHMTVAENLSFGLRVRKTKRDVINQKVEAVAKTLELDKLLKSSPADRDSGWRWAAPSFASRACFSSMSRFQTWMRGCARRCAPPFASFTTVSR